MNRRAWTVPSVYAACAIVAGIMLPRLERFLLPELAASMSVSAAMAISSSIDFGMISGREGPFVAPLRRPRHRCSSRETRTWIALDATKPSIVYRLNGNAPTTHE
jgi:hypothetical protein